MELEAHVWVIIRTWASSNPLLCESDVHYIHDPSGNQGYWVNIVKHACVFTIGMLAMKDNLISP